MAYRRMATIFLACALGATQAQASDDVSIETFDGLPIGTTSDIVIYNVGGMFDTTLSGGEVVAETTDFPAHSGTQVYRGTKITLVTQNEDLFTWPGVGAWVSGRSTITLQAYEYDEATLMDVALTAVTLSGGGRDHYLSIDSDPMAPLHITKVEFSSDSDFAMDDLTLGIEGISPGIPEPASWAIFVGGFGMVGGAMRARRRAAAQLA